MSWYVIVHQLESGEWVSWNTQLGAEFQTLLELEPEKEYWVMASDMGTLELG